MSSPRQYRLTIWMGRAPRRQVNRVPGYCLRWDPSGLWPSGQPGVMQYRCRVTMSSAPVQSLCELGNDRTSKSSRTEVVRGGHRSEGVVKEAGMVDGGDKWRWDSFYEGLQDSETFTPPTDDVRAIAKIDFDASTRGSSGPIHASYPGL